MPRELIELSSWDLAVASLLILAAGGVSLALRLNMERTLLLASLRTVVQLMLIGYVLRWVFELDAAPPVIAIGAAMILAASHAAIGRASRSYRGVLLQTFLTLTISATLTTLVVTAVVIRVEPWYTPQYLVPLLGMILGNGLTGISLTLDALLERLALQRDVVEMELALGATRWEAARDHVAEAVRKGMIPILNAMMVVGIVSLPGMMTGQILAGADPLTAVKYQIVVMFMIAAATATGCILIAMLSYRIVFNDRHQLRENVIWDRDSSN